MKQALLPLFALQGKASEELRGSPYLLPLEEISRRTAEAWARGATEVCLQG
jgi:FO synthase